MYSKELSLSLKNSLSQFDLWKIKHLNIHGFDRPACICVHGRNILVTDTFHNSIKQIVIDNSKKQKTYSIDEIYYSKNQPLLRPQGIDVAANGDIYIADTGNNMIKKLVGNTLTVVAGCGNSGFKDGKADVARFNQPSGIAIDSHGNLIVADTENHAIRKVYVSQSMVETLTTWNEVTDIGLYRPISIALYKDVIIVSQPNHRIMKIVDGLVSVLAGTGNTGNDDGYEASFVSPMGILCYEGFVLVCDWGNHKIRAIDIQSKYVTTAAGSGMKSGSIKGKAKSACVMYPRAIGRASDGTIWISTSDGFQIIDCAEFRWRIDRLLWIGNLKNTREECPLAVLPKEMITEIIRAGQSM